MVFASLGSIVRPLPTNKHDDEKPNIFCWQDWLWVPYYTQHKVMDGLFHVYRTFEYEKALDLNIKFADWLYTVVENLSDEQVQEMLHCEHGGINESLADM